jgi:hypothetical protein
LKVLTNRKESNQKFTIKYLDWLNTEVKKRSKENELTCTPREAVCELAQDRTPAFGETLAFSCRPAAGTTWSFSGASCFALNAKTSPLWASSGSGSCASSYNNRNQNICSRSWGEN